MTLGPKTERCRSTQSRIPIIIIIIIIIIIYKYSNLTKFLQSKFII
jgi:hypothetical protein